MSRSSRGRRGGNPRRPATRTSTSPATTTITAPAAWRGVAVSPEHPVPSTLPRLLVFPPSMGFVEMTGFVEDGTAKRPFSKAEVTAIALGVHEALGASLPSQAGGEWRHTPGTNRIRFHLPEALAETERTSFLDALLRGASGRGFTVVFANA